MKSFSGIIKKITALLLCLSIFASCPLAFAEEESSEKTESPAEEEEKESIINDEELQGLIDEYIVSHGLNPENISIGYTYTETGDTWLYNPDKWYYSASIYKVPLFMIMAEKEHNGEYTQDSDINGAKLSDIEDMVLINSNNYYAHHVMNYLGGSPVETMESNRAVREMYLQYADLPRDYYEDNFFDYSYFTARFMTDVMETLYYENDRFPGIVERLKKAQPNAYFKKKLGGRYEVAQKYGALNDVNGVPFNHTAGIIYTPHPFILTVMTNYMGLSDETIADMAMLFEQYTLALDSKLERFRQEQEEAARLKAEEEKRLAEEEARIEAEKKAEAERLAREEAERIERERLEAEKAARNEKLLKISGLVLAAGALVFAVIFTVSKLKKKKTPEYIPEEKVRETAAAERKRSAAAAGNNRPARKEKTETLRKAESRRKAQAEHYKPKH